jgi:hypothetical protein
MKGERTMKNLLNWLERNDIAYERTDEEMLIFKGNHADGIFIDGQYHEKLNRYAKRNKRINWEWRANYTSIYCYGTKEAAALR